MKTKPIFSLLLVGGGLLAGALLGEVALRVLGYVGEQERIQVKSRPEYRHVEGDSWIFEFDPDAPGDWTIHDRTIPREKPPDETRVVFVGDSGTEGAFVKPDEAFPERFEEMLLERDPSSSVRAVNAGAAGMCTFDEYLLLTEKLLPLEPDVVVLGIFLANDINTNLRYSELGLEETAFARGLANLRRRSALAHFLYLQALVIGERLGLEPHTTTPGWRYLPPYLRFVDRGIHLLSYPGGELATYRGSTPLLEHAYELLREALQRFDTLSREHGFDFLVVLVPTPSSVTGQFFLANYPNYLAELKEKGVEIDASTLDYGYPTRRVAAICDELGIACVDPTKRMKRIGWDAFVSEDEHPSPAGHDCLALEVIDELFPAPSSAEAE